MMHGLLDAHMGGLDIPLNIDIVSQVVVQTLPTGGSLPLSLLRFEQDWPFPLHIFVRDIQTVRFTMTNMTNMRS